MTVEDCLSGNPLVSVAFANACTLPLDMQMLKGVDDATLLISLLQSVFSIVQRVKVVLDRTHEKDSKVEKLEAEKKKLSTALESSCQKQKEVEEKNISLGKELDLALVDICRLRAESHELRGAANVKAKRAIQLEAELAEKEAELAEKKAKLEAALKAKADLEASTQAEIDVAFRDGVEAATNDYDAQVEEISPRLFELGCRAALKKAGIPDDHPIYQDLPKLKDQEFESSSSLPSSEVPPPEAPPAEVLPEIVSTPPPEIVLTRSAWDQLG